MIITRIKAKNLFSWKHLDEKFGDGTHSLCGENGNGKTAILEIISWVSFKKTTKKHVGADFGALQGWGEIHLDDGEYIIKRNTKEPMKIWVNGDEVEQDYVDNLLGCSYDTFMAAIMCNQRRVASFINEKTDTGKARIFGEMLGAGSIDKIRTKVSKRKNEKELVFESARSKYELLQEQVDTAKLKFDGKTPKEYKSAIEKDKAEYTTLEVELEELSKKYDRALSLDIEWRNYESNAVTYNTSIKQRSESTTESESAKANFEAMEEPDRDKEKVLNEKLMKADDIDRNKCAVIDANNVEISRLKKTIDMHGGNCPTCGSVISFEHIKPLEHRSDDLKKDNHSIEGKRGELHIKRQKISNLRESMRNIISEYENAERNLQFLQRVVDNLPKLIKPIKPTSERIDARAIKVEADLRRDTLFETKGGIRDRIALLKGYIQAERSLKEAESTYKDREKDYYIAKWLFTSLPLIKLMFIEENKMVLESAINEYLSTMNILFMVKIDTQKELKSKKEIKDEFSFQILSANRKVDRADLSGGEETIILLATQFAINDLISPNLKLEIYDEIYGSLSDNNVSTVVDAIKERGDSKQVFTISHKPEISNSFDSSILIKKNEDGSYVERI